MIDKPLAQVTQADLEALVANKIHEGRTLDYKRDIHLSSDEHRREVARDVSSFANAAGGDLIFGLQEAEDAGGKNLGYPDKILGVECSNFDATKQRFESIVRDTLDPRVPGIEFHKVDGFERGPVILVRIPKSWIAPHMVTFSNQTHFYSRNNSGKQGLDVREIRAAFLAGSDMAVRVRRFRDERLGLILAGETPVVLRTDDPARLVVHVVPLAAAGDVAIDLVGLNRNPGQMLPLAPSTGFNRRFNVDGFLTYAGPGQGPQRSYSQAFRDGAFEGVCVSVSAASSGKAKRPANLFALKIERYVVESVESYAKLLRGGGFEGPLSVMITLLGVRGMHIYMDEAWLDPGDTIHTIDKDTLVLPDVLLEGRLFDVRSLLRPTFDALWQASGWERSLGYAADGTWDPRVQR